VIAIIILLVVGIYVAIAIWAIKAAVSNTRAGGSGKAAQWLMGGLVALIFYLIPFWDLIPVAAARHYYCENQSGFRVRKSVDQWKTENKEVLSTLWHNRDAKITKAGEWNRFPLNQRLASERKYASPVFLAIKREEGRIVDLKSGEILAEYVDFPTGYAPFSVGGEGSWKFWLAMGRCTGESKGIGNFMLMERAIQRLGSEK
jgi:hypothetical protein